MLAMPAPVAPPDGLDITGRVELAKHIDLLCRMREMVERLLGDLGTPPNGETRIPNEQAQLIIRTIECTATMRDDLMRICGVPRAPVGRLPKSRNTRDIPEHLAEWTVLDPAVKQAISEFPQPPVANSQGMARAHAQPVNLEPV